MLSKEHTPKVTVLMPVHNSAEFLAEAIESVLNQTYKDFEFLIINDGSTDNSAEIIQQYTDPRIVYIENEKNLELTVTLNRGLRLANGALIVRMDADDISEPKRIEKQVDFMDANPQIIACGTWAEAINQKGEPIDWQINYPANHNELIGKIFLQNQLVHPSVVFRRHFVLNECGGYNEKLVRAQDLGLWGNIVVKGGKLANIQETLVKYRVHDKMSSTDDYDRRIENSANAIFINTQAIQSALSLKDIKVLRSILFLEVGSVELSIIDKFKLVRKFKALGVRILEFSDNKDSTNSSFDELYVKLVNKIFERKIVKQLVTFINR